MKLPRYSLRTLLLAVTICSLYAALARTVPGLAIMMLFYASTFLAFLASDQSRVFTGKLLILITFVAVWAGLTMALLAWFPIA